MHYKANIILLFVSWALMYYLDANNYLPRKMSM